MPTRGEDAPELAHLGELTGLGDVCEEECERGGLGGDHMFVCIPGQWEEEEEEEFRLVSRAVVWYFAV